MAQALVLAYYSLKDGYVIEPYKKLESFGILPDVLLSEERKERNGQGRRIGFGKRYIGIELEAHPTAAKKDGKFEAYDGVPGTECWILSTTDVKKWFGVVSDPDLKAIKERMP
jgi:hypothetical protein